MNRLHKAQGKLTWSTTSGGRLARIIYAAKERSDEPSTRIRSAHRPRRYLPVVAGAQLDISEAVPRQGDIGALPDGVSPRVPLRVNDVETRRAHALRNDQNASAARGRQALLVVSNGWLTPKSDMTNSRSHRGGNSTPVTPLRPPAD